MAVIHLIEAANFRPGPHGEMFRIIDHDGGGRTIVEFGNSHLHPRFERHHARGCPASDPSWESDVDPCSEDDTPPEVRAEYDAWVAQMDPEFNPEA